MNNRGGSGAMLQLCLIVSKEPYELSSGPIYSIFKLYCIYEHTKLFF